MSDEGMPLAVGASADGSADEWARLVAGVLNVIPREDEDPRSLVQLCAEVGVSEGASQGFAKALTVILSAFGVIKTSENSDSEVMIKASARAASYFMRSLSIYIQEGRPVFHNWGREANPDGSPYHADVLKGPQFLALIERERRQASQGKRPSPLREARVSQVIIKARVRGLGACYLHEYNRTARMFQLIGGHKRHDDASDLVTMQREAAEELPRNDLDFLSRDHLESLGSLETVDISRTAGVNTRYHFNFYLARFARRKLYIDPAVNRWIPEKEVTDGRTRDGTMIAQEWTRYVNGRFPGGLRSLPYSLNGKQATTLKQVLRERPWEAIGLLIGVLGIILGMIPLL